MRRAAVRSIAWLGRQIPLGTKLPITELSENRPWAQMPAGPCECGISVHVFGIDPRTGIEKHLNCFFGTEGRRAVQRCFGSGSDIAHEGVRFHRRLGDAIGIGRHSQEALRGQDHGNVDPLCTELNGAVTLRYPGAACLRPRLARSGTGTDASGREKQPH